MNKNSNLPSPVVLIVGSVLLVLIIATVAYLLLNTGKPIVTASPSPTNLPNQTTSPTASFPATPENLESKGKLILSAWKNKDSASLASFVDPEQGVRFTTSTTVSGDNDLIFAADEFSDFFQGTDKFTWGISDGKGEAIELTPSEYYAKYIWDKDYSTPTQTAVDKYIGVNTKENNWKNVYSDAKLLTYYLKGKTQNDWSSLSLVLRLQNNTYYLVGVIHSQWTA